MKSSAVRPGAFGSHARDCDDWQAWCAPSSSLRKSPGRELAGLTEAPEIGRHDGFHRDRIDAEAAQGAAFALGALRNHVVDLEHLNLIGSDQWLRHELQEHRLQ